jgi:pimeloyl-ACP methyl ester carboxylesterase
MHLANFVNDTLELTALLRERFNQDKIFLWGHSWGSSLGFETLRADSEPYYAFFASAVRPEWETSQELGYELLLQLAREAGDAKAVQALTDIQPFDATNPEHLGVKGQIQSQYLVGDFHTEGLEQAWLNYAIKGKSPEYPKSTVKNTMAGLTFTRETIGQEAIHSGYNHMRDLPASEIPVFFFAGRYDYVSPGESAEEYYTLLQAPAKEFIWFENSAHDVFYDEAGKFSQEVIRIAQELLNE